MPKRKTTQHFIEDAIQRHGSTYNYSKVMYVTTKHKVTIICNTCMREFQQVASSHLSGQGCPKCSDARAAKKRASSLDHFIKAAGEKHGLNYDYSNVMYVNNRGAGDHRLQGMWGKLQANTS